MKRRLLSSLVAGTLCLALCMPGSIVYADGEKVVTLGADLSPDQKNAILKYFGILGQNIKTLTINNQDERDHLGSYVPLEQIGTHTYSCALVSPTSSGGIKVKTANLNWVTSNMIASTLSTSGVVNCDVIAASPFEVSGTGALTGIIMAYEAASGTTLDPVKKDLATQELITTGNIANQVGQTQATNIVNEIKIQVIQGQAQDESEVEQIVDEVVNENPQVELSDEDRALLTGLMTQIAEQHYDYDDMKDTLERVEENVNGLNDKVDQLQSEAETDETDNQQEPETETEDPDSILNNTDDSALGEDVITNSTQETAAETEPETESPASGNGFEISTSDSYNSSETEASDNNGTNVETPEPAPSETAEPAPSTETEGSDTNIDLPSEVTPSEETPTEEPVAETPSEDAPAETETITEAPAEEVTGEQITGGFYVVSAASGQNGDQGTIPAAGTGQIRILFQDSNIVVVSGSVTITDENGNQFGYTDLSDSSQVISSEISDNDRTNYCTGWDETEGTAVTINLSNNLPASRSFTAQISAVVVKTEDPSLAAQIAANTFGGAADVETATAIQTDTYGVSVDIARLTDVTPGSVLTGNVYFDENQTYASISDYDEFMISFNTTDLSPDAASFQVTCFQSGDTAFTVDFYDADGNYTGSTIYQLSIR